MNCTVFVSGCKNSREGRDTPRRRDRTRVTVDGVTRFRLEEDARRRKEEEERERQRLEDQVRSQQQQEQQKQLQQE